MKKLKLEVAQKRRVGVDEDINLLLWGSNASSTLNLA